MRKVVSLTLAYFLHRLIDELHSALAMATFVGSSFFKFSFGLLQMSKRGAHVRFFMPHVFVLGMNSQGIEAQSG